HADEKKPAHLSLVRDALEIIGDIRLAQGKSEGAMKAYRSLLEQYGENKEYPNIVYKIGKIYFDAKNFAEAQKSWGSLSKMQEGQMWNRLASEHLQQASWDQKYNKYMERSPAGGNP